MDKIKCFILDCVEDDYHPTWEIFASLKKRLNTVDDDKIVSLAVSSINQLLAEGLIQLYEGYRFAGEQKLLDVSEIENDFFLAHLEDWKKTDVNGKDYRYAITPSGVDYLSNNCNPDFFSNTFWM